MNKRIKKKHLKANELMRFEYSARIVQDMIVCEIFSCPVEKGNYPVKPRRYRTYLKKRNLHKRHTQFGSKGTKYGKFNGDATLAMIPIEFSTDEV